MSTKRDDNWLRRTIEASERDGVAVVTDVLDAAFVDEACERLDTVRDAIHAEVGEERLARAGELGVLRFMMRFDPFFLRFLEIPELLAVVDATVSETAILHLQNGFILPSFDSAEETPDVFQNKFHMDFRRVMNGYLASMNVYVTLDPFTEENGATLVVPGSHQQTEPPDRATLAERSLPAVCPAGSMLVFDSTLWHAAGRNVSGRDRRSINHQFTRSFLKQQVDYCRALSESLILAQKPRTQQLLGWYTRLPTSPDEYYRPPEERLYRAGQG